ncbi:TfuA-like protein [Streptomyces sp. NPDC058128]|uniref:TfuA-like protein n=1 Tax=Streptomyces sp. NPDC058128 TaxID=3346352 RepID=UPI0036E4A408
MRELVRVHAFIGPTLSEFAARENAPKLCIHPPARHGDFIAGDFCAGDIVVLIDGLYHGHPPIRHKEILDTMARGVTVVGASSMGALRAAELSDFGMIGVGSIFKEFRDGLLEADDEVAVLHTEGPEWQVLSDALVNMRYAMERACKAAAITPAEGERLVKVARSLHYPRRSWRAVERACEDDPGLRDAARRLGAFVSGKGPALNLKYRDACEALRYAHDLLRSKAPVAGSTSPQGWPDGWRTTYLRKWHLEFNGARYDDRFVSRAAQFDYQRLFAPDQVRRWRRYVLSAMTGLAPDSPLQDLEEQALDAAARENLRPDSIPAHRARHWVSEEESQRLSPPQLLLALLVRASRPAVDLSDEPSVAWLLPQQESIGGLIAASLQVNEKVVLTSFSKHIDHLKVSVLERHLDTLWSLANESNGQSRNAAARDRGFASASDAAEALRPFFLKDHNDRRQIGA